MEKSIKSGTSVFTYSIGGYSLPTSPAPSSPPPNPARGPHWQFAQVENDLKSLPPHEAADVVKNWLHDTFNWSHTKKGALFWHDVWQELDEIHLGRAP